MQQGLPSLCEGESFLSRQTVCAACYVRVLNVIQRGAVECKCECVRKRVLTAKGNGVVLCELSQQITWHKLFVLYNESVLR